MKADHIKNNTNNNDSAKPKHQTPQARASLGTFGRVAGELPGCDAYHRGDLGRLFKSGDQASICLGGEWDGMQGMIYCTPHIFPHFLVFQFEWNPKGSAAWKRPFGKVKPPPHLRPTLQLMESLGRTVPFVPVTDSDKAESRTTYTVFALKEPCYQIGTFQLGPTSLNRPNALELYDEEVWRGLKIGQAKIKIADYMLATGLANHVSWLMKSAAMAKTAKPATRLHRIAAHESLEDVVVVVIALTGMKACHGTQEVTPKAPRHELLLSGTFFPAHEVLVRIRILTHPTCVALELVVYSNRDTKLNQELSQQLLVDGVIPLGSRLAAPSASLILSERDKYYA